MIDQEKLPSFSQIVGMEGRAARIRTADATGVYRIVVKGTSDANGVEFARAVAARDLIGPVAGRG